MKLQNLLIVVCISSSIYAQKKVDIKLDLRDGNSIIGTTTLNDVVLKTNYGQLTIPIQNINSVQTGIGSNKAISDKTNGYMKILNSNNSEELKKDAFDNLLKLDICAISAINDYLSNPKNISSEPEIASEYTIENALSELKSKYLVSDETKTEDVVLIDGEYSMGGIWTFEKLDIKTEYGNLSIPKDKIKSMDISFSEMSSTGEIVLKVNANKHISGNKSGGWLKTNINLKSGAKFTITASGEITLASLSNQKYKPDGTYTTVEGTTYPGYSNAENNTYPIYGNLVFKIGENGEMIKAGSKYNGSAKSNGTLYISIYETVYNQANTGSYTVKINLK